MRVQRVEGEGGWEAACVLLCRCSPCVAGRTWARRCVPRDNAQGGCARPRMISLAFANGPCLPSRIASFVSSAPEVRRLLATDDWLAGRHPKHAVGDWLEKEEEKRKETVCC